MLTANDKQRTKGVIRRKRKPVSLKESKAEQSDDFVLVPGASNWIALKKKLGLDKPHNAVIANDVDDHVTKSQLTVNKKPKSTMTKDIRGKRSATKLRHKLQRSGQSVNETGLTNTPISTKVLSSLITSGQPRKRQRKQNTIDTNESLQPFKKRPIRDDVWFDDLEIDMVEGELVAKQSVMQTTKQIGEDYKKLLITGPDLIPGRCLAIDCEMVGGGQRDSEYSMLARCSIVNHHGNIIYDNYVKPMDTVVNYRTKYSGIKPELLTNAPDFSTVQREVSKLIKDRILIGHSVHYDLKVLYLSHPKKDIRDTACYLPFRTLSKGKTPSLKKLAQFVLGLDIQEGEHDSIEDARVAMKLYQLYKHDWERSLREKSLAQTLSQQQVHRPLDKPSRWKVRKMARRKPGRARQKEKCRMVREELIRNAIQEQLQSKPMSKSQPYHIVLNSDI